MSTFDYYQERLLGLNQKVSYLQNGQTQSAIIRGIDKDGHLLVEHDNRNIEALFGSEIHFSSTQFSK